MARDICVALGERIRDLRMARGWRQIDLAEQAGFHENYVSNLELGGRDICLRKLQSLAHAFDMNIVQLFDGVE
jgi:transcriptional regulator with XRE-family HTH domain